MTLDAKEAQFASAREKLRSAVLNRDIKAAGAVVRELIAVGATQPEVEGWATSLLDEFDQEEERDIVLDLLDYITGWCSPANRYFP